MSHELLSAEMKATANALRSVRAHIVRLVAEGMLPEGSWPDASTVQVLGLDVAEALERLVDCPPVHPASRTSDSYLNERR